MFKGVGVDITTISRFTNKNESFIKKILHPDEIKEYNVSLEKERFLASRWSIKEAIFKANNKCVNFNSIFIKKENNKYFVPGFLISTSSENDLYISIAVKEGSE